MDKEPGMSIFLDVFRRADKNDSETLSWEQFRSFFADGIFAEGEMQKLFNKIDTHNTNEIDTGELCLYMSQHLGAFKAVFAAIETLNASVSTALKQTSEEYEKVSQEDQFLTRFFLREILSQMCALHRPLVSASDAIESEAIRTNPNQPGISTDEQAVAAKTTIEAENLASVHPTEIIPGRFARRARRQLSTQTSWPPEAPGGAMALQMDRLTTLIDRLENKVNFANAMDENILDFSEEKMLNIVLRKMTVADGQMKAFRSHLKSYVSDLTEAPGYIHVNIRHYANTTGFLVYEIWSSEEEWKNFLPSSPSKKFRKENVDFLEMPEVMSTLKVPEQTNSKYGFNFGFNVVKF
ncbi:hypothetical protein CAPTEDRAFT_223705 [Capitella teleta]|uniref:ABM domain-containing protein n=1 Tax=Capitella teleta TaxID=283909 RepID=R7UI69_CAPTE|nr:hypothetical protein CAPTEDRAFT_223705 [Capitella teleta]|eukprot:ELU06259.1 hypothetical protein CAPTEDRAFT_223705 [Capitella teleta]